MKLNAKTLVLISLLICLISSIGASIFQSDFGQVEYHDMTFVTESGHELDALLLVPKTATVDNKAPAIVVSHGWYNNREMQDLNYVEYARRGYVVLAISMYGHGDSEVIESNTWWNDENNANGLYDGVKYLTTLPYVDTERIGVTGHSNGALACREAVLQDAEGLIAAALLVSNDAVYYDEDGNFYNQFGSRDAAIVACQYDEFFHRVDGNPPREYIHQVTAQSFLHFGKDPAGLEERVADTFYTQEIDGTEALRAIYNPAITHPWAHFSSSVVAFSVDFFDRALGAPNDLAHTNQIWQWKAVFNALGVIGFFAFVVCFALALLDVPYFAVLKTEAPVMPWPALEGKAKKRYWSKNIWSAVLSIPFYFLGFILGFVGSMFIGIWNQGGSLAIGMWSLLCGLFTILTIRGNNKKFPVDLEERGVKLGKDKLIRTIVLALTVVSVAFALVFISDYLFLTDYRLWCFATIRAFRAEHIWKILAFLPFWLVYYIATSVANNCYNYTEMGKKSWISVVWQAFFVFIGPQFMIMAQYITFFISGKMVLDPITGIMGIWLFPIVLILPLASVISHLIYRKTKNPYIGGIIMAIIACIMTVTNTLTG
ncbi:MAG: acetylxylan esterase [Clostridia bacterium]|nr:acetylxylan esterase [Clostridia bacterium]